MDEAASLLLDARDAPWSEFVARLDAAASSAPSAGAYLYVRAPRRCAAEAARVVRAMRLDDHVHLLSEGESAPADCAAFISGAAAPDSSIGEPVERMGRAAPPRPAVWRAA